MGWSISVAPQQSLAPVNARKGTLALLRPCRLPQEGQSGSMNLQFCVEEMRIVSTWRRTGEGRAAFRGEIPSILARCLPAQHGHCRKIRNCWSHSRLSLPRETWGSHKRQKGNWGMWHHWGNYGAGGSGLFFSRQGDQKRCVHASVRMYVSMY